MATNLDLPDLIPLARNIKNYHMGVHTVSRLPEEERYWQNRRRVVPQTLEYNVKELHKFLFDAQDYQVPSNVKQYSEHIASVSGMYKEGKLISHVPVDQGINARNYINRQVKKQADKVAATAKADGRGDGRVLDG